jgi:hypothetical protein
MADQAVAPLSRGSALSFWIALWVLAAAAEFGAVSSVLFSGERSG